MNSPSQIPRKRWRRLSLLVLSLLPIMAVFHLVMWFGFTRTLFRPETGDLKRIGYLVGYEDCMGKLEARQPTTGFTVTNLSREELVPGTHTVYVGDSFGGSVAMACSRKWHEPVAGLPIDWSQKHGLTQIMAWVREDWFRQHGIKTIIVERVQCEWLDDFADQGDSSLNIPLKQEMAGRISAMYQKASPWTFANNGNFKVIFCSFAYLFSPTAFKMTDTCIVPLKQKFFDCSYGSQLLFYRGDITRGVYNAKNMPRFERAVANVKELSDLCHQQGLNFYLVVPPSKSYLYYDWVERPFYPDSKLLEALQEKARSYGYVDLKQPFHQQLEKGVQDFYYPDDLHWNYPAAEITADELTKAGAGPSPTP